MKILFIICKTKLHVIYVMEVVGWFVGIACSLSYHHVDVVRFWVNCGKKELSMVLFLTRLFIRDLFFFLSLWAFVVFDFN